MGVAFNIEGNDRGILVCTNDVMKMMTADGGVFVECLRFIMQCMANNI